MAACWNVINTEWDPDQETVNFGTRQCVVVDSAIFDVVTLATVECTNPGTKSEPRVNGSMWEQFTVMAVDSYCHILTDNCQTVLKSFSLDSFPNCLGWSLDGKFLFIVTEGGFMSVIYIPDSLLLATMPLPNFSIPNQAVYITVRKDEVLLLNSSGVLLRLSNLNLESLATALSNKNGPKAQEIQSAMKQEVVECLLKTKVTAATVIDYLNGDALLVIGSIHGIFLWDFTKNVIVTGAPLSCILRQIEATSCSKFIIALDDEGRLICYDVDFLLPVYYIESNGQFVFLELDKTTKRILTTDLSDMENRSIIMRSFKGSEIEYRVLVSDFCYLISSSSKQNDIMFIEGARDRDGNVTTLRIRKMAEGRPIDRLRRLIARGRFDEGLHFAQNFDLDMQLVYTAKATRLSHELSVWANAKPEVISGKFKDFIDTVDCITELRFVVESCLKCAPTTVEYIRSSLSYARKRLNLNKNKDEECERVPYILEVCNVQEKLDTFELIYGQNLIQYWYTIDMKDMFNTLIEILNLEEMTSALILWQRHSVEIVTDPAFGEEETLQLLGSIPSDMNSTILLPWLQHVLPSLVQFDSERIPLVIDWIIRKAASFESTERQEWPRNALKFADILLTSLKKVSDGPMAPLFDSIQDLKEMVVLYENYKIPITFSKFTQENKLATIILLLNWLPTAADVGPFLDVFLLPFMRRRALDIDESIFHYILNLLHNSVSWWHSGQAQWEQIVATLITYIKSIEVQAKSILAALCQAPVPWSSTVTELAEKGKKLEHPLAEKIKEEHSIVPLKTVLRHYNIHVFDLTDTLLMNCIVRNILKQQTKDCLEHALTVAMTSSAITENNVRTTYLTSLMCSDKHDLIVETLGQMSNDERADCCRNLMPNQMTQKRADACMNCLNGIWKSYTSTNKQQIVRSWTDRISDLRNVHRLMSHGVAISTNSYCYLKERQNTLRNFCNFLIEKEVMDYTELNSVAHLLSLPESFALQEQILCARSSGKDEVMVTCSQRLLVCLAGTEMAEACYLAAQCLNQSSHAHDTIELQSQLAAKAATYCSSESLMDPSELCCLVNLRNLILKRSSAVGTPDIYSSISSLGVYQDFTTPILNRDIMKYLSTAQARVLPCLELTKGTNSIVGLSARVQISEAAEALREFAKECLGVIQVLRGCRQLMPALYLAYASDSLVHLMFLQLPNLDLVAVYNKTISKHFDELSSQLLVRVMTANRPDIPDMALATSCLLILGPTEGFKYLVDLVKRSTSDRRRVFYIGFLGRLLFKLAATGGEEEEFFDSVILRCHWSMKLAPFGIHVQIPPVDEMLPIMDTLVTLEDVPLELISSFCSNFPLNLSAAYISRAQYLIVSTDATNMKGRIGKIHDVLSQLAPIEVQKLVQSVRCKVSPYNYELLSCLLGILYDLQPDALEVKTMIELLEFLSCYERSVPPGIMEQQTSFYRLPGSDEWPQKRLPMYYQIDSSLAKNIYYEEFHISNWTIWYNSPSLLPINRDEICMMAVNNTVKRYNKDYLDQAQVESVFHKIKQCLDCISTVSRAAACAGDITQRLTTSPENYYAAELHMQQCEKWKNENDPPGVAAYNKSVKVHHRVQTEESLAYFKLWNKRYETLTPYPERLIRSLFEDCGTSDRFQDINSAAENICQIFNLNLKVLKHSMMQEWLPMIEQYQQEDFYQPYGMESNGAAQDLSVELQNKQNLERVICLLSGSDYVSWVAYLREKALNDEERPAVRMRALTALQAALTEDQMMEHMELHSYTLNLRIKVLNFLSRLEVLGLVYKEDEFEVTDKADLIRALLQSGASTQRCITLAMDLATCNIIQDADIWSSILERVVKFNLLETAHSLIKDISEIRYLWINPVMAAVWNLILQAPFKQNSSDVNCCISALERLWSCPILEDIDLDSLEKCVLNHDYPYLAALLLPFIRNTKRLDLIQKLQGFGTSEILEKKLFEKCPTFPYLNLIKSLLSHNS
ncbi:hypothetical protein DAPPUDRAFT_304960 [Daphnia pulex]|uniref:Uncharacterized protein n=1 Tax=Daphnia pulex TaxID=6669 RepID=E9GMY0_DAPPU|nr:hypothetical protein DAPPUDRAFT_304960 [Daphnia pulex]|eukprot:EFX79172.1 hypothetical protein DAPPUDRAFT_304960 [Daphnia pulex]